MRGKPVNFRRRRLPRRIIPAHAGQTGFWAPDAALSSDHPRACGANMLSVYTPCSGSGSSPRMRGKHRYPTIRARSLRIIPAHAGQTTAFSAAPTPATDHPRACGANRVTSSVRSASSGSSPRMRGKRFSHRKGAFQCRIIPAHAGQTRSRCGLLLRFPDHPRACGANEGMLEAAAYMSGSSPRMRGKQSDFMRKLLSAGPSIIGFAQWLQSSYYCSCLQSSAKTPISRGTTPTSLFLGFQNSITLLLLT